MVRVLRTSLLALAAALVPQVAFAATPPPEPPGPPPQAAGVSSIPSPSSNSELYSVACSSPSDCQAVGFYANDATANLGEALRFTGGAWSRLSVPEPGGRGAMDYDYLDGVACPSRSDCWAVGYHGNRGDASVNEILRWTGRRWTKVKTPQPAGPGHQADRNELHGVACPAASDCWAVGTRTNKSGGLVNEALHWNGKRWKTVATPNPAGAGSAEQNVSEGVSCSSRSYCTAVGYGLNRKGAYVGQVLRWDGRRWLSASLPQPGGRRVGGYGYLQAVTCLSASDCWADGGYLNRAGGYQNEALMWNGKRWTQAATPDPGGSHGGSDNELTALACSSSADCWAVGYYYNHRAAQLNEALHWDGTAWSLATMPQPGGTASNHDGNALYGLSCASSTDCWAVGYTFNTRGAGKNQALLWDGTAWSAG